MELTDYLSILRKYWRSATAVTLAAVLFAALFSMLAKPTYTSNASLFLSVRTASSGGDLNAGSSYAESQVQSFAKVARSDIVLQPVIDNLGLATTPSELAKQVTVSVPTGTATLDIAVVQGSPEEAARFSPAPQQGVRAC